MNSEKTKQKFGVSKTTYKNMKKKGLSPSKLDDVQAFKAERRARKKKQHALEQKKHEASKEYKRTKGKASKNGKTRASTKKD